MNTRTSSFLRIALLTVLPAAAVLAPAILSRATAEACSIPVFRYALQFWQPDTFDALIFHRGELEEADEKSVQKLTAAVNESIGANVNVQRVDLADENLPGQLGKLWEAIQVPGEESLKLPHMLTLYPRSYGHNGAPVPAESVSLTELRLDRWMTSPARTQVSFDPVLDRDPARSPIGGRLHARHLDPVQPAGRDGLEAGQVARDVEREAVHGHPPPHPNPDRCDLPTIVEPDAREPHAAAGRKAEVREGVDHHRLERSKVDVNVPSSALEVQNGIGDELARTVVRDVAPPVDAKDLVARPPKDLLGRCASGP